MYLQRVYSSITLHKSVYMPAWHMNLTQMLYQSSTTRPTSRFINNTVQLTSLKEFKQKLKLCAYDPNNDPAANSPANTYAVEHPTVILAGFYLEELAAVRVLLDHYGGYDIRVLVSTPELLSQPLAQVLGLPEPAWDEAMPASWVHGQGWGTRRTVLLHNLATQTATVAELIALSGVGDVYALATSDSSSLYSDRLGDLLATGKLVSTGSKLGVDFVEAVDEEGEQPMIADDEEDETEEDRDLIDVIDRIAGVVAIEEQVAEVEESVTTASEQKQQDPQPDAVPDSSEAVEQEDDATVPEVENFILSKSQLQETLQGSGLDVEDVLAQLKAKGIELS